MNKTVTAVYSLVHFVVDLCCAVLVTNLTLQKTNEAFALFFAVIIYNFCAFALQLPIGIIADRVSKNALFSAFGCLLVGAGYFFMSAPLAACIIAGLGNAMFHIGGGIDVLNLSGKRAAPSGIFVSTGALGIFLGAKQQVAVFALRGIVPAVLIASAVALVFLYIKTRERRNRTLSIPDIDVKLIISVVCLFVTVCIRSYVGMILAYEWKSITALAVLSIIAVILGKMLGGIIGDKVGFIAVSVASLGVSAVCFIFSFDIAALGIIAILLFNMTMPITLTALAGIFENAKGTAFGLLTLALFVGALPKFFGYTALFTPAGLFALTAVSAVILFIGLKLYYRLEEVKR